MTDYKKLVDDLRDIGKTMFALGTTHISMDNVSISLAYDKGWGQTANDAAAAIEALQAEVERLKASNEELREKQTFIDHYGTVWMTSAKDVPTSAYEHGYADGRDEAEAQLPKRSEWVEDTTTYAGPGLSNYKCSLCGKICGTWRRGLKHDELPNWCGNCGADMRAKREVQE